MVRDSQVLKQRCWQHYANTKNEHYVPEKTFQLEFEATVETYLIIKNKVDHITLVLRSPST